MNKEKFANGVLNSILSNRDGFKSLIEQWLHENPQEPVVVGLSVEQIEDLSNFIQRYQHRNGTVTSIENWLKTQTFAQPEVKEVPVGLGDEQIEELSCLLYPVSRSFERGKEINDYMVAIKDWLKTQTFETLQARPKPTPQVEVGQIWKNGHKQQFEVIAVNDKQVVRKTKGSGDFMINSIEDFLARFEQVQS